MLWVFGIIFLVFVAIFAFWLYRNSARNRALFENFPRKKRILVGVLACVCSFSSALSALKVAEGIANWERPAFLNLAGVLGLMMLFVVLQVASMLSFVSLITDSETPDDSKRS